ncbi:hypothetical protein PV728_29275 [Streptomyces europaeiscabiei]|uniref:hypothetical protein n=1 Tax=Streptomyces europaeiscabiei TaxID=146819 RepID=UPI0029AE1E55|nr:hypothetical protein [Streptomyces europaeiscabiei]MDX3634282.1 hypothetical protein [Streptomyces europaeiscabiei]MDX3651870.1 hypothetical protein [Streptomyces europaeiscabiei]
MEQATQPAPTAAPVEAREPELAPATILDAHAVAGCIITQLATFPRDIDIKREFGGEYSVQIFWSSDVSGVAAFAQWAKVPWHMTPSKHGDAVYAEARSVISNVDVWAWTLLTKEEAVAAEQLLTAPRITPTPETCPDAEPTPVPLGESPVAEDPAAAYDRSLNRYVASLGGSVVALVPAVDTPTATDDPSTISFAQVTADTTGGEQ